MFIIQVAAAFFITFISGSYATISTKSTESLPNCTNYKSCVPPFDECDSLTGACQLTSRFDDLASHPWKYYNFNINPRENRFTSVVCSDDGNYPSRDCGNFYHCVNGTGELKTCNSPGLPYFDPVSERCTSSSNCPVFRCFEKFNVRVELKGQLSSFFAYCFAPYYLFSNSMMELASFENIILPYVVTRCYGKDIFNANTGRCEPRCLQEGLLPDTTDCSHYYLCTLQDPVNAVFSMVRLSCPQGQAFLQSEVRCVPEDRVSACSMLRPWPL